MVYDEVLDQFRKNVAHMQKERDEFLKVPEGIDDLFKSFLNKQPSNEDILNLLGLLCNTDNRDWDTIAHHFL